MPSSPTTTSWRRLAGVSQLTSSMPVAPDGKWSSPNSRSSWSAWIRWASLGVDARRPLAGDPRQDVDVVRREVDGHADVADPGRERAGAPAERSSRCVESQPSPSSRPSSQDGRVEPLDVADLDRHARRARRRATISSASSSVAASGFSTRTGDAALDRGERERHVGRRRGGDDDGVELRLARSSPAGRRTPGRRTGRPRRRAASATGSATAASGRHGRIEDHAQVVAAHRAEPDEADAHRRGHRRTGGRRCRERRRTIVASSSSVSSGCTGMARTSSARRVGDRQGAGRPRPGR